MQIGLSAREILIGPHEELFSPLMDSVEPKGKQGRREHQLGANRENSLPWYRSLMFHPRQLIAARALAGWSQTDLAAAAGVGLSTIKGLEGGSRDTKFSSVMAIIEALRERGIEFAQGSERYLGGVLIVRGSASDWLLEEGRTLPKLSEQGGNQNVPFAQVKGEAEGDVPRQEARSSSGGKPDSSQRPTPKEGRQ